MQFIPFGLIKGTEFNENTSFMQVGKGGGDLYAWAGKTRVIGMNKADTISFRPEYFEN